MKKIEIKREQKVRRKDNENEKIKQKIGKEI